MMADLSDRLMDRLVDWRVGAADLDAAGGVVRRAGACGLGSRCWLVAADRRI